MKKNVLVFGLISGAIITTMMLVSVGMCMNNKDFEGNKVLGYAAMIAAFSFIFLGVKNFRDKYNEGVISFSKAFRTGLYISLVASTLYVLAWLVDYYLFVPDFMDSYSAHMIRDARNNGASAAELQKTTEQMAAFKELYKNPLFVVLISYSEVLPVGVIIAVITGLVLKRKRKTPATIITQ